MSESKFNKTSKGNNIKEISKCFPNKYCLFDIETTGLSGSAKEDIIEIAALKISNGNIIDKFQSLIAFDTHTKNAAYHINHISPVMLIGAPFLEEVLKAFFEFIGNYILVGHNIHEYDIAYVYDKALKYNLILNNDYIDIRYLSQALLSNDRYSVEALSAYYNIDYSNAHRALTDCYIEYEIYKNLCGIEYTDLNSKTVRQKNNKNDKNKSNIYLTDLNWSCFKDRYVAITGKLRLSENKELIFNEIKKAGGNKDSVTRKCNYLISADNNPDANTNENGEKESIKIRKAKKHIENGLPLKILSEAEFYEMIGYGEES